MTRRGPAATTARAPVRRIPARSVPSAERPTEPSSATAAILAASFTSPATLRRFGESGTAIRSGSRAMAVTVWPRRSACRVRAIPDIIEARLPCRNRHIAMRAHQFHAVELNQVGVHDSASPSGRRRTCGRPCSRMLGPIHGHGERHCEDPPHDCNFTQRLAMPLLKRSDPLPGALESVSPDTIELNRGNPVPSYDVRARSNAAPSTIQRLLLDMPTWTRWQPFDSVEAIPTSPERQGPADTGTAWALRKGRIQTDIEIVDVVRTEVSATSRSGSSECVSTGRTSLSRPCRTREPTSGGGPH